PLDLIRAVIGFYSQNQTEVDAYVKAYQDEIDRQAALPPGPCELRMRRLMEMIRKADEEHKADPSWSRLSIMEKLQRIEGAEFTGTACPMARRYVRDEQWRGGGLWRPPRRHNVGSIFVLDAVRVGDPPDLPLRTLDPAVLLWAEREGRILVSK